MKIIGLISAAVLTLFATTLTATTMNKFVNGSFFDGTSASDAGWTITESVNFGNYASAGFDNSGYAYSFNSSSYGAGSFITYSQTIDLTDVSEVGFDIFLSAVSNDYSGYRVVMSVGGVEKWTQNSVGYYNDQSIDVTGVIGNTSVAWTLITETGAGAGSRRFNLSEARAFAPAPVPLPAGGVLIATALAGLGLMRRWRGA